MIVSPPIQSTPSRRTASHLRNSNNSRRRWCSTLRQVVLIVAVAIGHLHVVAGQEEDKLPLQPFQIRLHYNDLTPMKPSDEMMILNSTMYYLSSRLSMSLPDFSNLMLYQFVRDYVVGDQQQKDHYSKVAMNGIIYFTGSSDNDQSTVTRRPDDVQTILLENLLGENVTSYIDVLHESGMMNVVNVTLLSIEGNELVYRDGQIFEVGGETSSPSQQTTAGGGIPVATVTLDMDEAMMRRMTLLLCLLIPGVFIFMASAVFVCRSAREINWRSRPRKSEHVDSVWQTSQHYQDDDNVKRIDSSSSTDDELNMDHYHFGSNAV
jgi:hypothetical protein